MNEEKHWKASRLIYNDEFLTFSSPDRIKFSLLILEVCKQGTFVIDLAAESEKPFLIWLPFSKRCWRLIFLRMSHSSPGKFI